MKSQVLGWDAMLNMAKVELEPIPDPDIFILFEKDMRGEIFNISNSYSNIHNKYLKPYDPKQNSKHILYLDVNNLYSYVVSKFLPTSRFKWIEPKALNLKKYTSNSSKGCILEVDFEYLKELFKLHIGYPFAPDKIEIIKMLSSYQLKIADFYNIPMCNLTEMAPNISHKEKYVLCHENLQLYLRLKIKTKRKYIAY